MRGPTVADESTSRSDSERHPPKPTLTLRVGISGHRPKPDKFPETEFARVTRQLGEVFLAVEQTLTELGRANGRYYARDSAGRLEQKIRLVSGLAEGADQLAAAARLPNWKLDAVLPFPVASYRHDFEKSAIDKTTPVLAAFDAMLAEATTKVALPDDPRIVRDGLTPKDGQKYWDIRNQGYARLGKFLLGQIDVLVAVWDGKREEGPGGTAEVVRGALAAGIAVIWISSIENVAPRVVVDVDTRCRTGSSASSRPSSRFRRRRRSPAIGMVPARDSGWRTSSVKSGRSARCR
jgi:hypothetical protein